MVSSYLGWVHDLTGRRLGQSDGLTRRDVVGMIEFHGVSAGQREHGLHDLSFRVGAGEVYALYSASATACATVTDISLGRIHATAGAVQVCGHNPASEPREVRRLTTVVSPGGLAPDLTVRANVRYVLTLCGQRVSEAEVDTALRRADLPDRCVDRPAASLRPRESVSVWLALARLRRTPVLICERLPNALDTLDAGRVAALLRDWSASGHAVLVTTRAPLFARSVADRCGTLEHGRVIDETARAREAGGAYW